MPEFNESDHPRASNGQFGSGGGGSASKATEERRETSNTVREAHGLGKSALKSEQGKSQSSLTEAHREQSSSKRSLYGLNTPSFKREHLSQAQKTTNKLKAGAEAAVHEKIPRGRFYSNLRNEGYTPEQANEAVEHYDRVKKEKKGSPNE